MNLVLAAGLLATPLGKLLVGLVALAAVVLVGRILLNVAWKLLLVAIVVVGALYTTGVLL
ncbi:hypothetical protein [Halorussus sp. MSC15.2]|uniref:hypothetical protein n=1 Tax=Halorussus sp. MSC15.2 TaxID=2283638 RepID=UPI0013D22A0C|nr:hypothetical protein [Halorussus sp. MSC15.2]NEU55967.1 hypothetical protein [Halorussus sp. MSC15.2]